MSKIREIFQSMPGRYLPSPGSPSRSYYFSIGEERWTVVMHPDRCEAHPGKTVEKADVVLKCDPALFERIVLEGKLPGPLDIARGRIKTNDPAALQALKSRFRV